MNVFLRHLNQHMNSIIKTTLQYRCLQKLNLPTIAAERQDTSHYVTSAIFMYFPTIFMLLHTARTAALSYSHTVNFF